MPLPYLLSRWYHQWARDAAIHFPRFSLAPRHRKQVLDEIHPKPSPDVEQRLIAALEGNISYYKGRSTFEKSLAPRSHVRSLLSQLEKRFHAAEQILDELDWHTRFRLAPTLEGRTEPSLGLRLLSARKPPEMERLDERLCDLGQELRQVAEAAAVCRETVVPKHGGRRHFTARELLAVDIAESLQEFVPQSVPIVTTEGKPYENIVRICVAAADGEFTGDAHRLILAAVELYESSWRPYGLKLPRVETPPD